MPGKVPQPWYREATKSWYVCIDGKQHALGKDKDEAFRRFHLLMAGEMPTPKAKPTPEPIAKPEEKPTLTLRQLADAYLSDLHRRLSPTPLRVAKWMVEDFASRFGSLEADAVRKHHVESWIAKHPTWASSTENLAKTRLEAMYCWGMEQGLLSSNAHGVGSGEGLIERIADPVMVMDKYGKAQVVQAGALDKRCLLRLSELSQCFKKGRRENATLSENLREAWDGEPIHLPNRRGNALSASGYAISLLGDITSEVLRKTLASGTEGFDGHANRFLWAAVKRSRFLPSGGSMDALKPYLERLQSALAFAKEAGELKRDAEAESLWAEIYPSLACSGDEVPHTDRARPYVVRLSMLYALADASKVIKAEHLKAALAVWAYCRESARLIFGGQQEHQPEAVAEPLWLQVLNAISKSPGIKKEDLTSAFKNRMKSPELDENLRYLEAKSLAYNMRLSADGKGRPAECWFPGKPGGDGDGESREDDNLTPSSVWTVQAEASKEVSNSSSLTMPNGFDKSGIESKESQLLTSLLPCREEQTIEREVGCHPKSQVRITDISPPPNAPLEAEADEALEADAFLSSLAEDKPVCLHPYRTAQGVCVKCCDGLAEWREAKARREAEQHQQWLVAYAEGQAKREARERQQEAEDAAYDDDLMRDDFLSAECMERYRQRRGIIA